MFEEKKIGIETLSRIMQEYEKRLSVDLTACLQDVSPKVARNGLEYLKKKSEISYGYICALVDIMEDLDICHEDVYLMFDTYHHGIVDKIISESRKPLESIAEENEEGLPFEETVTEIGFSTIRKMVQSVLRTYGRQADVTITAIKNGASRKLYTKRLFNLNRKAVAKMEAYYEMCEEIGLGIEDDRTALFRAYEKMLEKKHEENVEELRELIKKMG